MTAGGPQRVLAVASAGGHFQQLMMLRPAFAHHEAHFLTTLPGLAERFGEQAAIVPDCNRNERLAMARSLLAVRRAVRAVRPSVVISTGALPGVFALVWGRRLGARTIWVDSVANAEEMSASGRLARRWSDLWLTQWEAVAEACGADHAGSIL